MVKKNNTDFDAEFAYAALRTENDILRDGIAVNRRCNMITLILCIVISFAFGISSIIHQKRIESLGKSVLILQCEKDAAKVGANFAVIDTDGKTECHIFSEGL